MVASILAKRQKVMIKESQIKKMVTESKGVRTEGEEKQKAYTWK